MGRNVDCCACGYGYYTREDEGKECPKCGSSEFCSPEPGKIDFHVDESLRLNSIPNDPHVKKTF